MDAPQNVGITQSGSDSVQLKGWVSAQSCGYVDAARMATERMNILSGAHDE
jgi:hypothetical protein